MMRESCEFRVDEEFAHLLFRDDEGVRLGGPVGIRKIVISTSDPRFERIGQLNRELHQRKPRTSFFFGWFFIRKYRQRELASAELLKIFLRRFEPEGESCGTRYDESTACPYCRAGRRQVSDLILDLRKIPKNCDMASTIADEWIVSQRLAELMLDARITGFTLAPVRHKARYRDDPWNPDKVPMGKGWLQGAEEKGLRPGSPEFLHWMLEETHKEYVAMRERRDRRHPKPMPCWYQLIVTSCVGRSLPPTRFGINPFDDDAAGEYRCPLGHVSGLNALSEVFVARNAWDASDICVTENCVGTRRGVLVPRPMLLISQQFFQLLRDNKIRGFKYEVAHLV